MLRIEAMGANSSEDEEESAATGRGPEAVPSVRTRFMLAKWRRGHEHALVAVMAGTIKGAKPGTRRAMVCM